jgi:hypothetical protein
VIRALTLIFVLASAPPALADPPPRPAPEARGGPRDVGRPLDLLAERDPERHRKLVEVREARPGLYRELIAGSGALIQAREGEGRERLLAMVDEVHVLHTRLTAYEQATGRDRDKARAEVEASVARLFELRQQARRAQLAALEARLAHLRSEIAQRDAARADLVDKFTDRVTAGGGSGL